MSDCWLGGVRAQLLGSGRGSRWRVEVLRIHQGRLTDDEERYAHGERSARLACTEFEDELRKGDACLRFL